MASLRTTDEVIDALGGNGPAGALVGASPKAVSNWRSAQRGQFPPETYIALTDALSQICEEADPKLWGMIQKGDVKRPRAGKLRGKAA